MSAARTFSRPSTMNNFRHYAQVAMITMLVVSAIESSAQNFMTRNYDSRIFGTSINRGDFNKDGVLDFVVGNGSLSVFPGRPDGSVASPINTDGAPVYDLAVGDYNRDGNLDVATAASINSGTAGAVQMWLGNGDGRFRLGQSQAVDALLSSITTGDFNNDGKLDLATASDTITIWTGTGDGGFQQAASLTVDSLDRRVHKIRVGDFDADGRVDFAVETFNDVIVYWNDGGLRFLPERIDSVSQLWDMTPVDVNQDSFTDLVYTFDGCPGVVPYPGRGVGCPIWEVRLGQGDGTRRFRLEWTQGDREASGALVAPTAADINGDGINDVVMVDRRGLRAWLGNSSESYAIGPLEFVTGTGKFTADIVPGDFNRDGRLDFALTNPGDATVTTMLNAIPREDCQTYTFPGTVTVCKPQDYTYSTSPLFITGRATDIDPITATQVYVDHVLFLRMASASFDRFLNLPAGNHLVVTKGWNASGKSFRSDRHVTVFSGTPGETCSTGPLSITMCAPAPGASSGTALRVFAAAMSDEPVTSVQVYIDHVLLYDDQSLSNYVDKVFNLAPGSHLVVVKAWDATGRNFTDSRVVTAQ